LYIKTYTVFSRAMLRLRRRVVKVKIKVHAWIYIASR